MQAGHALVGALMPEYDPVQKISIVPRGSAGGLTFFAPSEERLESGLYSKTYLENQLAVALGGRVAEELIFGEDDVTTGASSDFMQVEYGPDLLQLTSLPACRPLPTRASLLPPTHTTNHILGRMCKHRVVKNTMLILEFINSKTTPMIDATPKCPHLFIWPLRPVLHIYIP